MKKNACSRFLCCLVWALCCALWTSRVYAELLIVQVSPQDEAPAQRLTDLLDEPSRHILMPEAHTPENARPFLERTPEARQLVILDAKAGLVHVLHRDGVVRTRSVQGAPPAAYLMAFVASELLSLHAPAQPADLPQVPAESRTRALLKLAFEASAPYRDEPLFRARLGLDLNLAHSEHKRWVGLLGAALGLPGHIERDGNLNIDRWDTALRGGLGVRQRLVQWTLLADLRAGFQKAQYSGAAGVSRRTQSLGVGAGWQLDVAITRWLGFFVDLTAHWMARRNRYQIAGEMALRERAWLWSGALGVAVRLR